MVRATIEGLQGSAEETDKTRYCRLNELSSKHTNHSWMWAINPAHGLVLLPDHFLTALRLRLGIRVASYAGSVGCGECGRMCTAEQLGDHALLCGKGQRTILHDRVRDLVADLAKLSDSTTRTEVAWRSAVDAMIDGQHTELRPADILTSASPFGGVGLAALDVGITSPHSVLRRRMGIDPLDFYRQSKVAKYRAVATAAGWDYRPFLLGSFGRADEAAVTMVRQLVKAAARSFGISDTSRMEAAWWRNCGTLVAERGARMVARCSPVVRLPRVLGGRSEDVVDVVIPRLRGRGVDVAGIVHGYEALDAPARG